MKQKIFFLLAMLFCITLQTMAQTDDDKPENKEVDMDVPTFEPMVKVGKVLLDHDSIQYVQVNNVYVYPQPVFKNAKERMAYNRLVYNTTTRSLPSHILFSHFYTHGHAQNPAGASPAESLL